MADSLDVCSFCGSTPEEVGPICRGMRTLRSKSFVPGAQPSSGPRLVMLSPETIFGCPGFKNAEVAPAEVQRLYAAYKNDSGNS